MRENQGIRVLPLIRIPPRPQLLIPVQGCKTKTPTMKKLPPMLFPDPSPTSVNSPGYSPSNYSPSTNFSSEKFVQSIEKVVLTPPTHSFPSKVNSSPVRAAILSSKYYNNPCPRHTGEHSVERYEKYIHEPLTPMTKNDIHHLLRNSIFRFTFQYLNVYSIADMPKASPDNGRQIENLINIYHNSGPDDRITITKYVMQSVVRETPKFEKSNPFSEQSPIYVITNSQQLEKLHALFQSILNDDATTVSRKFLSQLIRQLDTNVDFERKEIEKEIIIYLKNNHSTRPFILQGLISKLIVFQELGDNFCPPFAIPSILRIFVFYFNEVLKVNNSQLSKKAKMLFKSVFFPLHSSEHFVLYEKPLKDISTYFMSKDAELATWCINYLCKHWPLSSPRKEIAFLQQLGNAMQFTDPDTVDSIGKLVSRTLARCISSETINVSVSAMLDLSSNNLLSYFDESLKGMFLNDIIPALEIASKNWKAQLSEMSTKLLDHLKREQKKINNTKDKKTKLREQNWTTIRTLARSKRAVNSQKTLFHSTEK